MLSLDWFPEKQIFLIRLIYFADEHFWVSIIILTLLHE